MEAALRRLVWAVTETPTPVLLRTVAVGAGLAIGVGFLARRLLAPSSATAAAAPALDTCPATYKAALNTRFEAASQTPGALAPLVAQPHLVPDGGLPFILSVLDPHRLAQKQGGAKKQGGSSGGGGSDVSRHDAFASFPAASLVGTLNDGSHRVLLNKYYITPQHVVITTADFEPQHAALSVADLGALYCTVKRLRGLGFFNCGEKSGASQPRRHTQFIPFEALAAALPAEVAAAVRRSGHLPIDAAIGAARAGHASGAAPGETFTLARETFPVPHAVCMLGGDLHSSSIQAAAETLKDWYHRLLVAAGVATDGSGTAGDHNLLLTPTWAMVVNRSGGSAEVEGISINALGFAGLLLAKPASPAEAAAAPGDLLPARPLQLLARACGSSQ